MSRILITGNGFDLFHHLPTKYGHFMAIMMTIEEKSFSENITFEELFGFYFKEGFQNDYDSIIQNYVVKNVNFLKSDLDEIKDLLVNNNWFKHFKSVLTLSTWIDFEIEIERILSELSILFDASRHSKTNTKNFRLSDHVFNENFIVFGFSEIITIGVVTIKNDYLVSRTGKINEVKILKNLVESLNQFTQIFNKYLVNVVEKFMNQKEFKYSDLDFNLMDKIYTFNYTHVFEKLYNIKTDRIVYLHGKSNKLESSQNLVFGISDIPESLKNNKIFDFTKYYQKIRKNNNCKFIELPSKTNNNHRETIFYIIGHSLDESDAKYIVDLFKYLELDSNKYSKICVFYFDENDFDTKLNNLIKIIGEEIVVDMNKTHRLYFERLTIDNLKKQFNIVLKESKRVGIKV